MKYLRILTAFFGEPWVIAEDKYHQLRTILLERAAGKSASDEDIEIAAAARRPSSYAVVGKTAIIPIMGVLAPRVGMMEEASGGVGAETIGQQLDAAIADKTVSRIVLHIDSPGGSVYGIQELGDKIRAARDQKKIIAVADPVAASGAYWLGSQASEFYMTPSGVVGSIGVISERVDLSKAEEMAGVKTTLIRAGEYKQEMHPSTPPTDEAVAYEQSIVNQYYDTFLNAVAKGRGVTASNVRENYGKGRILTAADAKAVGMVDGIATFERVLRRLEGETGKQAAQARARAVEIS